MELFLNMEPNSLKIFFFFVLCFVNCGTARVNSTANVAYGDVKELFTCSYINCSSGKNTLFKNGCDCGNECIEFDTCCVDAFREEKLESSRDIRAPPSCRSVAMNHNDYDGYFVVDQCPNDEDVSSTFRNKCTEEWHDEADLLHWVPVRSLVSNVTYRNYFCFRCNEGHDEYVYSELSIGSYHVPEDADRNASMVLSYDGDTNSWIASLGEEGTLFDVHVSISHTDGPVALKQCFLNVISTCSEIWQDNEVRKKCEGYTFITDIIERDIIFTYKNPHCALCNFENLNLTDCSKFMTSGVGDIGGRMRFPLSLLFYIKEKIVECNENSVWDSHFKKCRPTGCTRPGYSIKNGKCVPP